MQANPQLLEKVKPKIEGYIAQRERENPQREETLQRIYQALNQSGIQSPDNSQNLERFSLANGNLGLPSEVTQEASSQNGTGDPDLDWIISKESEGKTSAANPKSSAFGLGQLLIDNRENYGKKLGYAPDTTDYNEQLHMMKEYIKDRYGTVKNARRFWEANGWY